MKLIFIILSIFSFFLNSINPKLIGRHDPGKYSLTTPFIVPCLRIRLNDVPAKLSKTKGGYYYLNAKVQDHLRLTATGSCDTEIQCSIYKLGKVSNRLPTNSISTGLETSHNYVNCTRKSTKYLEFHLFVQDGDKFFNSATFEDRGETEGFLLKCLGGFYSENVVLKGNGKTIDVPYNLMTGFHMDPKKYSKETFYQCKHNDDEISFLYYPNQNTYGNSVEFKMQIQSYTINNEIRCIIKGEAPDNVYIKPILACPTKASCPRLSPRTGYDKKAVYTASLSKNSRTDPRMYSCVFLRDGKVEAIAKYYNENHSIGSFVLIMIGIGVFFIFVSLLINKIGIWNYKKINNTTDEFCEDDLLLSKMEEVDRGYSSKICKIEYIPTTKPVVIKISKQNWMCHKELKILKSLKHANLIAPYGSVILKEKRSCFVMRTQHLLLPYYPNMSLEKFIQRFYPVARIGDVFHSSDPSNKEATITLFNLISFGCQIASALKFLKEKKITHRDVAMRNVLITDNLLCKLTDFERAEKGETRDVSIATKLYSFLTINTIVIPSMYPVECAKGAYFYESEVYCFGLLLLEMFSFKKHIEPNKKWPPTQPQHCPPLVYGVICKSTKKERKQRLSINDCFATLEACAQEYGTKITKHENTEYEEFEQNMKNEAGRDLLKELKTTDQGYLPSPIEDVFFGGFPIGV